METKDMLYLVSEYARQGEIFGKSICSLATFSFLSTVISPNVHNGPGVMRRTSHVTRAQGAGTCVILEQSATQEEDDNVTK